MQHGLPLQIPGAQVRGNRIEAAARDDARARFPCGVLVLGDHLANPMRFAGEIAVVAPVRRAHLDQGVAEQRVGADGGNDHAGLAGERGQCCFVIGVGDEYRHRVCIDAQLCEQGIEFGA